MVSKDTILRAKKKDPEAFEIIYLEFKDFVWNLVLKITGNRVLAEDAASEVFIKVFKKIKKFKFKASFKTWLYRLTVNTTLNYLDRENRKKTKHLIEDYKDLKSDSFELEKEFDKKNTVDMLLNKLDNDQKMIVVLREVEGLSYNEIAQSLDMPLGTVKTNIYRARDRLRKIYKNEL